jgi:hypothetical protein
MAYHSKKTGFRKYISQLTASLDSRKTPKAILATSPLHSAKPRHLFDFYTYFDTILVWGEQRDNMRDQRCKLSFDYLQSMRERLGVFTQRQYPGAVTHDD